MAREKAQRQESLQQRQAFDYYYNGGQRRKFIEVARKFQIRPNTVTNWNRRYGWQERALDRDKLQIEKVTENTTFGDGVATKTEYRETVRRCVNVLKAIINQGIEIDDHNVVTKVNIKAFDWEKLMKSLETLVKLDLLLIGEATEKEEHSFVMEVVGVDINQFPEPFDIVSTEENGEQKALQVSS